MTTQALPTQPTKTSVRAPRTGVAAQVWAALGTVTDPELGEAITELGFVHKLDVDDGEVIARLRLPTYFCAPNFAYLMVADAADAIASVAGVTGVDVQLEDHFASEEINAGVAASTGFSGSFPRQADGELAELRLTFQRKAHLACLERACRKLIADGWQVDGLAGTSLGDLPESTERDSLLRRRADLGFSTDANAALFVDNNGEPVPADELPQRLRFAKAVRVSVDGNAAFCRGLLHTRYGTTDSERA